MTISYSASMIHPVWEHIFRSKFEKKIDKKSTFLWSFNMSSNERKQYKIVSYTGIVVKMDTAIYIYIYLYKITKTKV